MNLVNKKRQNDLFDTEQLLYLAVPELPFLSADRRAYAHLQDLEQGRRIHLAQPDAFVSLSRREKFSVKRLRTLATRAGELWRDSHIPECWRVGWSLRQRLRSAEKAGSA
jgi:hypothetical protein